MPPTVTQVIEPPSFQSIAPFEIDCLSNSIALEGESCDSDTMSGPFILEDVGDDALDLIVTSFD